MCQVPSSLTAWILSVVGWLYSPLTPSALNKFGFKEFWPGSMVITAGSALIVEVALMRPMASSARVEATSFASAVEASSRKLTGPSSRVAPTAKDSSVFL